MSQASKRVYLHAVREDLQGEDPLGSDGHIYRALRMAQFWLASAGADVAALHAIGDVAALGVECDEGENLALLQRDALPQQSGLGFAALNRKSVQCRSPILFEKRNSIFFLILFLKPTL